MKALQCDKCKKYTTKFSDFLELTLSGYAMSQPGGQLEGEGTGLTQNIYNVCPDCVKLLKGFLRD